MIQPRKHDSRKVFPTWDFANLAKLGSGSPLAHSHSLGQVWEVQVMKRCIVEFGAEAYVQPVSFI